MSGLASGENLHGRMNDQRLSEEMTSAATRATDAHKLLQETLPTSGTYQQVLNDYLQATVLYMCIVSMCQARQHEYLAGDMMELTEQVEGLQRQLQALRPSGLGH